MSRIDWYYVEGKLYFGEITLYESSGFYGGLFQDYDKRIGGWVDLPITGQDQIRPPKRGTGMKNKNYIYSGAVIFAIAFVLIQSMFSAEVSGSNSNNLARIIHSTILDLSGQEERSVREIESIIRNWPT